mmetsp:Transcript_22794/g.86350  ORF Transcript_22794/g.86350 Transcript_22794/m.86350 type:complete len:230 (+) Transcript_22794:3968-4657(+)
MGTAVNAMENREPAAWNSRPSLRTRPAAGSGCPASFSRILAAVGDSTAMLLGSSPSAAALEVPLMFAARMIAPDSSWSPNPAAGGAAGAPGRPPPRVRDGATFAMACSPGPVRVSMPAVTRCCRPLRFRVRLFISSCAASASDMPVLWPTGPPPAGALEFLLRSPMARPDSCLAASILIARRPAVAAMLGPLGVARPSRPPAVSAPASRRCCSPWWLWSCCMKGGTGRS